jgi:hypothetical protein
MPLEDICTSLEISRKLAEAGFPQEGGLNYWCFYFLDGFVGRELQTCRSYAARNSYRAFTFSELWEILPKEINFLDSKTLIYHLEFHKHSNYNFIGYIRHSIQEGELLMDSMKSKLHKQPQEAAAELALWCRKEGYL